MKPLSLPIEKIICFVAITGALTIGQGCTAISEKLVGKEHEEITPFAQKTVEVLAVENIQIHESELIHLRPYVDDSFVELAELQQQMQRVDAFRDSIIAYSIDLVRVTELYSTDTDRVDAYASHIEQTVGEMELMWLDISDQEWEQIVDDLRAQETLLDALRTFQPVINRASRDFEQLICSIETDLITAARTEFDRRIEADFMEINEFLLRQKSMREQLVVAMIAIDEYRHGRSAAIAEFRQKQTPIGKLFPADALSEQQIDRLETDLYERIKKSTSLIAEMHLDSANYEKARNELYQREAELRAALNIARVQITTWALAHQALANGVKDPGEWMELSIKAAELVRDVF